MFIPLRMRAHLRDGGDLEALHDVHGQRHAVLDGDLVERRAASHLHEPVAQHRRVTHSRVHPRRGNVQPVLRGKTQQVPRMLLQYSNPPSALLFTS